MGKTSIEWCDHSVNPIRARDKATGAAGHHCEKVSPGCGNCYASRLQARFGLEEYSGPARRGKVEHYLDEKALASVLRRKTPTKFFWQDMGDLFGEWVPDGWAMRCLDVMARTPQHTHQVLTKRPDRMADFFRRWADLSGEDFEPKMARGPAATRAAHPSPRGQLFASMLETMGEPPPGRAYPAFDWMEGMICWPDTFPQIWVGTSVENQRRADERIPHLLRVPAAVRFLSCEPLLGPVDLTALRFPDGSGTLNALTGQYRLNCEGVGGHPDFVAETTEPKLPRVGWAIVGGESGPDARPCRVEWVRSVLEQCKAVGVPAFCKQLGANVVVDYYCDDPDLREWSLEGQHAVLLPSGGEWSYHDGQPPPGCLTRVRLRDRKGGDPAEWFGELNVRQFPP